MLQNTSQTVAKATVLPSCNKLHIKMLSELKVSHDKETMQRSTTAVCYNGNKKQSQLLSHDANLQLTAATPKAHCNGVCKCHIMIEEFIQKCC